MSFSLPLLNSSWALAIYPMRRFKNIYKGEGRVNEKCNPYPLQLFVLLEVRGPTAPSF